MIALLSALVLANVVAVVTEESSFLSNRSVRLYPIAVYANGAFSDAVSDRNNPRYRETPLDWTHHFVLISRGLRVASADIENVFVPPPSSGSPCSRPVQAYAHVTDPVFFDHGVSILPGLAVSEPTPVHMPRSALASVDPRYARDVLAAAAVVLARVGKHPRLGPNLDQLHVQYLDVMDVYHDGQPEVFARVLGGDNLTIIWLAYINGEATVLHADTGQAAGGRDAGPNFIDTADMDGDGVDEVVIREQYDSSAQFEIYRVTHQSVTRIFQGGNYGC
jgi:hypothetical protein